jgi:hypothetical protein
MPFFCFECCEFAFISAHLARALQTHNCSARSVRDLLLVRMLVHTAQTCSCNLGRDAWLPKRSFVSHIPGSTLVPFGTKKKIHSQWSNKIYGWYDSCTLCFQREVVLLSTLKFPCLILPTFFNPLLALRSVHIRTFHVMSSLGGWNERGM